MLPHDQCTQAILLETQSLGLANTFSLCQRNSKIVPQKKVAMIPEPADPGVLLQKFPAVFYISHHQRHSIS